MLSIGLEVHYNLKLIITGTERQVIFFKWQRGGSLSARFGADSSGRSEGAR